jgi:aminoglycoside phosphotransferase (APT) family kinase protein
VSSIQRIEIDVALVRALLQSQFPRWAGLPLRPVDPGGWDNRTFRLGARLSVRLPSQAVYSAQVEKEQHWLPRLAPMLPLPIPVPVATGKPAHGYPWSWSVYQWIDGETASPEQAPDLPSLATALGGFLTALQSVDARGGPPPGAHNFHRGGALRIYDAEARGAIEALRGEIDARTALAAWEAALASRWDAPPVWIHGDVSGSNLLVTDGRLCAVIDFGCCGIGDPACDLAIAWTLFHGPSRTAFRESLDLDRETWIRGLGWALWKSCLTLVEHRNDPGRSRTPRNEIAAILSDFESG